MMNDKEARELGIRINIGQLVQIGVLLVAIAIAWQDNTARTQTNAERIAELKKDNEKQLSKFEETLKEAIRKIDQQLQTIHEELRRDRYVGAQATQDRDITDSRFRAAAEERERVRREIEQLDYKVDKLIEKIVSFPSAQGSRR